MAHPLLRRAVLAPVSARQLPVRGLVKTPVPPDCYVTCRAGSSNCGLKTTLFGSRLRTTHWMIATVVWCPLNRYDIVNICIAYYPKRVIFLREERLYYFAPNNSVTFVRAFWLSSGRKDQIFQFWWTEFKSCQDNCNWERALLQRTRTLLFIFC